MAAFFFNFPIHVLYQMLQRYVVLKEHEENGPVNHVLRCLLAVRMYNRTRILHGTSCNHTISATWDTCLQTCQCTKNLHLRTISSVFFHLLQSLFCCHSFCCTVGWNVLKIQIQHHSLPAVLTVLDNPCVLSVIRICNFGSSDVLPRCKSLVAGTGTHAKKHILGVGYSAKLV